MSRSVALPLAAITLALVALLVWQRYGGGEGGDL